MSPPEGLIYYPNLLTIEQEAALVTLFNSESDSWDTAGSRAARTVKHFGYTYPYTRKLELLPTTPITPEFYPLILEMRKVPGLEDFMPEQAIVNRYLKNQGISPHIDHPLLFGDIVVSISVGCSATMRFKKGSQGHDQNVAPRSLYAMTGPSRSEWTHEMCKRKSQCDTRYSITFRTVNHKYIKGEPHPALTTEILSQGVVQRAKAVAKPRVRARIEVFNAKTKTGSGSESSTKTGVRKKVVVSARRRPTEK